jgi:hypothetical protein
MLVSGTWNKKKKNALEGTHMQEIAMVMENGSMGEAG